MRWTFRLSAAVILAALSAQAQVVDPFWNGPDVVNKGEDGKVYFELHHDRIKNTATMFAEGTWQTMQYDPQGQFLWSDYGDIRREVLRDGEGRIAGSRLHVNGLVLTVHGRGYSSIGTDGFGPFTIVEDGNRRATAISDGDGREMIRFGYDVHDYLRSIITPDETLEFSAPDANGVVRETLRNADGPVLTISVSGTERLQLPYEPLCLEPVLRQLGLASAHDLTFRTFGGFRIGSRADGSIALYTMRTDTNDVVFDVTGKPLMVQLGFIPFINSSPLGTDSPFPSPFYGQLAVAPSYIVITSDGRTGGCAIGPAPGAIARFWSERDVTGALVTRYRTFTSSDRTLAP